jgi:hypothetical protein
MFHDKKNVCLGTLEKLPQYFADPHLLGTSCRAASWQMTLPSNLKQLIPKNPLLLFSTQRKGFSPLKLTGSNPTTNLCL